MGSFQMEFRGLVSCSGECRVTSAPSPGPGRSQMLCGGRWLKGGCSGAGAGWGGPRASSCGEAGCEEEPCSCASRDWIGSKPELGGSCCGAGAACCWGAGGLLG